MAVGRRYHMVGADGFGDIRETVATQQFSVPLMLPLVGARRMPGEEMDGQTG